MDEQSASPWLIWGEPYFDHFEEYFGPVREGFKFSYPSSGMSMQILAYDDIFEGCRVFCSFGLSRQCTHVGSGVAEVVLPIDEAWEETPDILANVLGAALEHSIPIGPGYHIRFGGQMPDFVQTYGKAALYFATPFGFPDGFDEVICGDQRGAIYLASFISEAEHQYALDHGPEALEDLFEAQEVDVYTLRRPSAV